MSVDDDVVDDEGTSSNERFQQYDMQRCRYKHV